MPGDPKECRQRAARCLELAAESANDGIKQMFLNIARHWEVLAGELERARSILDDEKGTLKIAAKKKRRRKSARARTRRKPGKSARAARPKRMSSEAGWGLW